MLKITAIETEGLRTLVLEGKLIGPWVAELERAWTEARDVDAARSIAIDLRDVTVISEQGEELLRKIMGEGATFHCCRGILTKHVVMQLMQKCSRTKRLRVRSHDELG